MNIFITPQPDLTPYDTLIGGYRTHVDQDVFLDRQEHGYGLWMYEEEEDVWQDHAEVYVPMTAEALGTYFSRTEDARDAIGIAGYSGENDDVVIAIIRARPGASLADGGIVPADGIFAMNGELFVPLTPDRAVGAHYVMYAAS
jgi:hypothetical protein